MSEPRLSVSLTVAFDAMSSFCFRGETEGTQMSRGEFDATALPRILELYRRHDVLTTWFIPGHTALAFPDLAKAVLDAGHEIGHHGWVHENASKLDERSQRLAFERGFDALDQVLGVRPKGFRSHFGTRTAELIEEFGFEHDSSLFGSDFTPYYMRKGDSWSRTEEFQFGTPIDVVEIPFSYSLDDWQLFEFRGGWTARQALPRDVLELWKLEFDFAYSECPGGVYNVNVHPLSIGRGPRIAMLGQLIEHMKQHADVVFEPLGDYAARWRTANPLEKWLTEGHPQSGRQAIKSRWTGERTTVLG
jgi:peptidoglycan/xylan/chitin deacetylase (PgdA/CDA1 family)